MMRWARIYASDVMDAVVVQATVFTIDKFDREATESETFAVTTSSVGSGSESVWLRDALVALAETL